MTYKFSKRGFNKKTGLHKITGTLYDEEGYNRNNFNKEGYHKLGYNNNGYNNLGYDIYGYDSEGFNRKNINKDGKTRQQLEYENFLNLDVIPLKKQSIKVSSGIKQWPRDPSISKTAIYHSNYKCQYDNQHKTFNSAVTNQQYMEAHHLIPMNAQDSFKNSLDVLGNVVSLCPNCHRMIHHGDEASKNIIIEKLYAQKEKELRKFGLEIILEDLKKLYK